MAIFGSKVHKFTAPESFRLFMEGVRSLQLYDDEADKKESDQPPDAQLLRQYLGDAVKFFQECVDNFPDDILPRYYLGIVLSMRGQVEQARQLRAELLGEREATEEPDDLFLRAAKIFEQVAKQASGDLLVYAQYNQAQALAKTGPIKKAFTTSVS